MKIIPMLLKEMVQEAETTRKMLAIVPEEKFDWKPHHKSMSLRQLTAHIAELPTWIGMVLNTAELDFATGAYQEKVLNSHAGLTTFFEQSLADALAQLEKATDDDLLPNWILRNGESIYDDSPKSEVIRGVFCQIVHHRAQLGVYLRLLDIPIPGSYGPSADEMHLYDFKAEEA